MRARLRVLMRGALVATIAMGALALPAPAHAAPVCLSDYVPLSPANEIDVCVDDDSPHASFRVYLRGEHVASGWVDLDAPNDNYQVRVYNESTVVSVAVGIVTDEVTGERSLVVCLALAAGTIITPIDDCWTEPLP